MSSTRLFCSNVPMIRMMKTVESYDFSLSNPFPMCNEVIPKHIRLDTTTLVHLLMTSKQGKKSNYLFKGNLKRMEDKIRKCFIRIDKQCFERYASKQMVLVILFCFYVRRRWGRK